MDHLDLIKRIPPALFNQSGLATTNLAKVEVDSQLVEEMLVCLRSTDEQDLTTGLRFAECLATRPDFCRVAGAALGSVAALTRKLLDDQRPSVKLLAIGAFVALRDYYPDYRDVMVSLLQCPDAQVRCEALCKAHTFLSGAYLRHLLSLREDQMVCQSATGKHYVLRDLALETAERITGRSFDCGRLSEAREGAMVSWRRWTYFEDWIGRVQRRAGES